MLLTMMAMTIQLAAPAQEPQLEITDSALGARLPDFCARPRATTFVSASDDPGPDTASAFGGRCITRQDSQRSEDGSSSTGTIVCGNRFGPAAAVLESLLRPQ